jgi:hypothetical protein
MMTVAAKIAAGRHCRRWLPSDRELQPPRRQEVYHIHMHLLGGRPLGPMLAHKGFDMLRAYCSAGLAVMIAGCSSRPAIPVSDEQTLVMESSCAAASRATTCVDHQ